MYIQRKNIIQNLRSNVLYDKDSGISGKSFIKERCLIFSEVILFYFYLQYRLLKWICSIIFISLFLLAPFIFSPSVRKVHVSRFEWSNVCYKSTKSLLTKVNSTWGLSSPIDIQLPIETFQECQQLCQVWFKIFKSWKSLSLRFRTTINARPGHGPIKITRILR